MCTRVVVVCIYCFFSLVKFRWPDLRCLSLECCNEGAVATTYWSELAKCVPALNTVRMGKLLFEFLSVPDTLPILREVSSLEKMELYANDSSRIDHPKFLEKLTEVRSKIKRICG